MTKAQIKAAAAYKNITLATIAAGLGTSKQNLSNKLARGTLTDRELTAIANIIGCEYKCYFEFKDGKQI